MKRDYDFDSTARIYKSHLKNWRVFKNVTTRRVLTFSENLKIGRRQGLNIHSLADVRDSMLKDGEGEVSVEQFMRYVGRKSAGREKLEKDPNKPLEFIKALSLETGKGRSGRARSSGPRVHVEQGRKVSQFQTLTTPPSELTMPWSPQTSFVDALPSDMTRLLQAVMDEDFQLPNPYACSPGPVSPTSPYQWQTENHVGGQSSMSPMSVPMKQHSIHDEWMLRFVLNFRFAHILQDDGLETQALEMTTVCLKQLSDQLQMTQARADRGATCTVLLYGLMAALEMAVGSSHTVLLHMLYHRISIECAGQHPKMAEFSRRLAQLPRLQQISMLRLARQMMSRIAFAYAGLEGSSLEMYSRTVEISIGQATAEERLQALHAMSAQPYVQKLEAGALWMAERVALSVPDAPWAAQQQGLWHGSDLWKYSQEGKAMMFLRYMSDKVDRHKVAGNWGWVEKWAMEAAWTSELTLGLEHELTRKFKSDAESAEPPMLEHGNVASVGQPYPPTLSQHVILNMGVPAPMDEMSQMPPREQRSTALSAGSWDQAQGQLPDTTIMPHLWNGAGGVMDGGVVALYDVDFFGNGI